MDADNGTRLDEESPPSLVPGPAPSPVVTAGDGQGKMAPRSPDCDPDGAAGSITPLLQEVARLRQRPLFVLVSNYIDDDVNGKVYGWRAELKAAGGKGQFDVLLHSPGGVLSECYRIARFLARCTSAWEALVPEVAASGATLICLGSSNVVMSETAQLSPLDPQVLSKRPQRFFVSERQSPLEAFQAVKYLREFSMASFDFAMKFLLDARMAPQTACDTATRFALDLSRPILEKIEPYDLGSFALDSNLAQEYCKRVAESQGQKGVAFRDLVEKYPAHEFVIDIDEAKVLGFTVSEPDATLDEIFGRLRPLLSSVREYIGIVPE